MSNPVTVIAPIKLAPGKTEKDLLAASAIFQREFVDLEPGVIRRELVRKPDGTYLEHFSEVEAVDLTIICWCAGLWFAVL